MSGQSLKFFFPFPPFQILAPKMCCHKHCVFQICFFEVDLKGASQPSLWLVGLLSFGHWMRPKNITRESFFQVGYMEGNGWTVDELFNWCTFIQEMHHVEDSKHRDFFLFFYLWVDGDVEQLKKHTFKVLKKQMRKLYISKSRDEQKSEDPGCIGWLGDIFRYTSGPKTGRKKVTCDWKHLSHSKKLGLQQWILCRGFLLHILFDYKGWRGNHQPSHNDMGWTSVFFWLNWLVTRFLRNITQKTCQHT